MEESQHVKRGQERGKITFIQDGHEKGRVKSCMQDGQERGKKGIDTEWTRTFNEALELNSLLGILDVCKFLARKFNPEKEHQSKLTQEERELLQLILKVQKDLSVYDKSKSQMNPNLQTLSNTLQELLLAENADPESRALVFVKARATCTALAHYLDGVLGKDNLHVYKLTGKGGDDGEFLF
ncbi:hypothetical protein CHS0354_014165 [Potamilus streckersoni]|uniref:Uncharacterized protein n=1 Tax=Potamilus streckersoni TaxID=2493646 RepID=A0AAE0SN58_9BIVA|nr:hypothetical protein CHS0354_014165 [Potamilus streckersoni]